MNKSFWIVVLVLTTQITALVLLVPSNWVTDSVDKEIAMMRDMSGDDHAEWVISTANQWHNTALIESGAWNRVRNHFIPTDEQKQESVDMGGWWFEYVDDRLNALRMTIYHSMTRIALLMSWLPYIALLALPALWDGLQTRNIKLTNFDYASPVIHRYALRAIGFIALGSVVLFLLPFAINPLVIPVSLMILAILMGLAAGNIQKRI